MNVPIQNLVTNYYKLTEYTIKNAGTLQVQ